MRKKLKQHASTLTTYVKQTGIVSLVQHVKLNSILPFTEKPSIEHGEQKQETDKLAASDLFSLFTADIIREQVVFTR